MNNLLIQPINEGNSGYTEIKLDNVTMVEAYTTIVHTIYLSEIQEIISHIENSIQQSNINKQVLQAQLNRVIIKFRTLQLNRGKRGLANVLGSGLKWMAGTMDEEDRETIQNHLQIIDNNNHNIIETANKQIKITNHFNETLTNLKHTIESDRDIILAKINSIDKNNLDIFSHIFYLDLVLKIKTLDEQIEHIQDNIIAANHNLMTNNILTPEEINDLNIDFNKLQQIQLTVAKYRNEQIVFFIKIPLNIITVPKSLIMPIKNKEGFELDIRIQEIVIINNTVYNYNNEQNISNLKKSNLCIFSNKQKCYKILNNKEEILEVEQGMVLLKNVNGAKVESNCDSRKLVLSGNQLLTFNDCKIKIDGNIYENKQKEYKTSFALSPNLNLNNMETTISLDQIAINEVENIKTIEELKYHKAIHFNSIIGNYFLTICIAIVCLTFIIIIYKKYKKSLTKIQENFQSKEGGVKSNGTLNSTDSIELENPIPSIRINYQE